MPAAVDTLSALAEPTAKNKQFEQKCHSEFLHQSEFNNRLFGPSSSHRDPCGLVRNKTVPRHTSGLMKHGSWFH